MFKVVKNNMDNTLGSKTNCTTTSYSLNQLESFCICLTFTCNPNIVRQSSIHLLLHPNCNHQVLLAKTNLRFTTLHHWKLIMTILERHWKRLKVWTLIDRLKYLKMFTWAYNFSKKFIIYEYNLLKKCTIFCWLSNQHHQV